MSPKSVFFFVIVLLTVSTITLVSIGSLSEGPKTDPWKGFLDVSIRLVASFVVFLTFSNLDYRIHKNPKVVLAYGLVLLSALVVVLILPSPTSVKRWIRLGGLSIQPSEFVKMFVVIFLAYYIEKTGDGMKRFTKGIVIPLGVLSVFFLLVLVEPDMSTTVVLILLSILMLYAGGARTSHVLLVLVAIVVLGLALFQAGKMRGYQLERLQMFLRGEMSEQTLMALESIKSGGWLGKGAGMGDVKLLVPAVESDFILAMVGEELGYIGIIIVLIAYLGLTYSLIAIAESFV